MEGDETVSPASKSCEEQQWFSIKTLYSVKGLHTVWRTAIDYYDVIILVAFACVLFAFPITSFNILSIPNFGAVSRIETYVWDDTNIFASLTS